MSGPEKGVGAGWSQVVRADCLFLLSPVQLVCLLLCQQLTTHNMDHCQQPSKHQVGVVRVGWCACVTDAGTRRLHNFHNALLTLHSMLLAGAGAGPVEQPPHSSVQQRQQRLAAAMRTAHDRCTSYTRTLWPLCEPSTSPIFSSHSPATPGGLKFSGLCKNTPT